MRGVNVEHSIQTRRPEIRVVLVVAMITAAAMSGSCFSGTATNLCDQFDRRCSPGQTCAANQDVCIDIGGCGDGIISPDKSEVCDDGNMIDGDGCSADCKSDEACGNGITDANETCDDNNRTSGDGCSADCLKEECGDSIYNPTNKEECDTGGDTQACNGGGKCTVPKCGDGYTNKQFIPFRAILPEQCDTNGVDTANCNGNNEDFDGPGSCLIPSCGDNYLNKMSMPQGSSKLETCDAGGDSPTCNGNTDIDLNSDGSVNQSNKQDSKCQEPKCGDGYVNPTFKPNPTGAKTEACDKGGDSSTCNGNIDTALNGTDNNKDSKCQPAQCGDGYVNPMFKPNPTGTETEACDTSQDSFECNGNNDLAPNGTSNNKDSKCQVPRCGDGYVNPMFKPNGTTTEECDTGGNSPTCNGTSTGASSHPNNIDAQCHRASCGDGYLNPMFAPTTAGVEQCEPGTNGIPCPGGANSTCDSTTCRCTP